MLIYVKVFVNEHNIGAADTAGVSSLSTALALAAVNP
jgi:hypothetical protein